MDRKYRQSRWYVGVAVALLATPAFLAAPALALDINSFRAQHKLPPLSVSGAMSAAAASHAADMAARKTLDHKGFRERMGAIASTAAENVAVISCARPDAKPDATFAGRACGCADEDCVYQMWAKSEGHKRNMLLKGITHYGIASATGEDGRRYWVLELGN